LHRNRDRPRARSQGEIEPGAGEINRHVEGVAGAADAESAIAAAHQLDDRFSDGDDAGLLLAHGAARYLVWSIGETH
jgi:hypothetical protein